MQKFYIKINSKEILVLVNYHTDLNRNLGSLPTIGPFSFLASVFPFVKCKEYLLLRLKWNNTENI